jgi:hypothetical protein
MARLVTRDPFARSELHAARVHNPTSTCEWCGSTRETPRGTRWLYQYTLEHDDGSSYDYADLYCSRGCFEDYHR